MEAVSVVRYRMQAGFPGLPATAIAGLRCLLVDGKWRGLWDMQSELGLRFGLNASEAAISARIRDLRREGWTIEKRPWPQRPPGCRAVEYRCPLTKETP